MRRIPCSVFLIRIFVVLLVIVSFTCQSVGSQQAPQSAPEKKAAKPADTTEDKKLEFKEPEIPAQIELLETLIRFEVNGDSRKEVHAHVKINSELGARQFARLNFDYNRSFESIEIPLVRVTHANGGTSDILPSAITDNPNPAVVKAPAYQDVRVKSVRILGLAPGDSLEYRVITTVSHHPLAPDFWLEHSFDRTGVVTHEIFQLDLPASRKVQLYFVPEFPHEAVGADSRNDSRTVYKWDQPRKTHRVDPVGAALPPRPDVTLSTFESWGEFAKLLAPHLKFLPVPEIVAKAAELSPSATSPEDKFRVLYDFVSQKIRTLDLPLGATGFHLRPPLEVISSGYATSEEKCSLLSVFAGGIMSGPIAGPALVVSGILAPDEIPRVSAFERMLVEANLTGKDFWLDPSIEVAPFGMVPANLRGKSALRFVYSSDSNEFDKIGTDLPFAALQRVKIDASLSAEGKLNAKVHYALRGDNELLLRVAFHQTAKDKWKDLANLLAISDGFRGQVSSVNVSDPYATREPFTVDYEITMPKFVDWTKKPVRIPALLPQVALPDPPAKPVAGSATSPIELGTPLEVETSMTLKLPAGTTGRYPTGTSVERDYATFTSQYARNDSTLTASRHIKFILREVPATRVFDYNAFVHAVQNDSAQDFTLERQESSPAKTDPAAPGAAAPPNPSSSKP